MSFLLNDMKNHDDSFSCGLRRGHSQVAFTRATFSQVRSQEFAMGGGCFGNVTPYWDSLQWESERFLPEIR